jgi:hypothetical protein
MATVQRSRNQTGGNNQENDNNSTAKEILNTLGIVNPDNKLQGNNLTVGEMKDLHQKQLSGEVEEVDTNKPDNTFKIPAHETHLLHASIENVEFDPKSGARKSKASVRAFDPQDFIRMTKERAFEGLEVKILHDPRNVKEQAAQEIKLPTNIDPEKMNEAELKAKYQELFGAEPDVLSSPAELRIEIKQKLEFDAQEAAKQ